MKKALLLAGLAMMTFGAFAQEVAEATEHIVDNGNPMTAQAIPGDLNLTNSTTRYMGTDETPNTLKDGAANKADEGMKIIGDSHNGDYVEFLVKNDAAGYFTINLDAASKKDVAQYFPSFQVTIFKGETAASGEFWQSEEIQFAQSAEWHKDFKIATANCDEELPVGTHLLRITFLCTNIVVDDVETNAVVANLKGVNVTQSETPIIPTTITCNVLEGSSLNDKAGSINLDPNTATYQPGTVVKITAAAADGYKFLYMEVNGEKVEGNSVDYTTTDTDCEVNAYFEEINMFNNVPGLIDVNTIYGVTGFGGNTTTKPLLKTAEVQVWNSEAGAYEPKELTYVQEIRGNGSAKFQLNVTEAKEYPVSALLAMKSEGYSNPEHPATGSIVFTAWDEDDDMDPIQIGPFEANGTTGWTNFKLQEFGSAELPAKKLVMTINFLTSGNQGTAEKDADGNITGYPNTVNDKKETFNLANIVVGDRDSGVIAVEAFEGSVKAYNVFGLEVAPDAEGIVIVNGKKVFNRK